MRRIIGLLAILAVLAATAVLGITTLLNEARVTELAKSQIARLGGDGYETDLTSASLQLFQNGIAGIQIDGITIRNAQTNEPLLERGKASFSISLASLLFGKIELTGLALADAQLYLAAGVGQSATLFHAISGPDGLVDPALAAQWLEDAASRVSSRLFANPDLIIGAQNTTMILGRATGLHAFSLKNSPPPRPIPTNLPLKLCYRTPIGQQGSPALSAKPRQAQQPAHHTGFCWNRYRSAVISSRNCPI